MIIKLLLLLFTSVFLIAIVNHFKIDNWFGEVILSVSAVMLALIATVFIVFMTALAMKVIIIPVGLALIMITAYALFMTKEIRRTSKIAKDKQKI